MDTEAQRVTSDAISDAAIEMGAPDDGAVGATVVTNTVFLDISCTHPDPSEASTCAQAYADAYVADRKGQATGAYDEAASVFQQQIKQARTQVSELQTELAATTSPSARASLNSKIDSWLSEIDSLELRLLAVPAASTTAAVVALPANVPSAPSNKGYITAGMSALILGLALGIGLAFVRERLDERVPDRGGFERALGAPVLAVVPHVQGWRSRNETNLVSLTAPNSAAAEAYRAARTTLLYLGREGGLKVVAITGPGQSEGKTTTVANLAVSLAQAGKRVVAVSADLRKPRLYRFFHVNNVAGTSDVLTGKLDVVSALSRTEIPNLLVMTSGPVPHNPAELLGSDAMDDMLAELRTIADIVLIDTAPTLVVSDMLGLAPKTDGVIVVADASSTHLAAIEQLRHQLERGGGEIVGGILNNQDAAAGRRGYGGYGRYGYRDDYRDESPETHNGRSNGKKSANATGGRRATAPEPPPTREPSELGF
jgi:capsular exopolysaccharide synthesis family protein